MSARAGQTSQGETVSLLSASRHEKAVITISDPAMSRLAEAIGRMMARADYLDSVKPRPGEK